MKDPHRYEVIQALATLQAERLMGYEQVVALIDQYDERQDGQHALQLMLDYEVKSEPVTLHEAMNELVSQMSDVRADRVYGA